MDPKLSNLDPKLQDAYNRVMNTSPVGPQQPPVTDTNSATSPQITSSPPDSTFTANSQPQTSSASQSTGSENNSNQNTMNQNNEPTVSSSEPSQVNQTPAPAVDNSIPVPPPVNPAPPAPAPGFDAGTAPAAASTPIANSQINTGTVAFSANNSHKNVGTTNVNEKGGHKLMPLFVGITILILLLIYTLVWIILFNVKIPFFPQL